MARRSVLAVATVLALAGCGGDGSEGGRVTGSVELGRPGGGPPDAGTRHGHGADLAVGVTAAPSFVIRGRVDPADSRLTIRDVRGGTRRRVMLTGAGRFATRVSGLRAGANTFVLDGRREGRAPWRLEVRIVRGAAGESGAAAPDRARGPTGAAARVPAVDRTPPSAALVVRWRERGMPRRERVVSGGPPARARLRSWGPPLHATAIGRDPEGVARARVSLAEVARCGGRLVRRRRYFPPPAIARVKVAPGALLPTLRRRAVRLRVPACSVARLTLWADVTNGHELESSSAPARLELAR